MLVHIAPDTRFSNYWIQADSTTRYTRPQNATQHVQPSTKPEPTRTRQANHPKSDQIPQPQHQPSISTRTSVKTNPKTNPTTALTTTYDNHDRGGKDG